MSRKSIINSIDLNLLKVLHAIALTGQITAAGDMIGLSQPAISHALKRLRGILDDELFVRSGKSLQMTDTCERLMPSVKRIVLECERVFTHSTDFDPAVSDTSFRIGMNDYFSVVLMPPLVEQLGMIAPHVKLQIVHMPRNLGPSQSTKRSPVQTALDEGDIDIAVMTADRFPARFACEPLFTEERVFITSKDNPANCSEMALEHVLKMGHVKITSDPDRRGWIDEKLDTLKLTRHVVASVPHFSAAVAIVSKTHLIAVLPKSVAMMFKDTFSLTIHQSRFLHSQQSTSLISVRSRHKEAAMQWVMSQIKDVVRRSG